MSGRTLLGLLAAAVLLFGSCATTPAAETVESYIQTPDQVLLHFQKFGDGPEVLIVPGASWCAADMAQLTKGRTVIFYDPRGRGRSDATRANRMDQDLEDLETVREWFGVERFALLGTDYQSALVARYAALHPDRVERLVLVSPIPVSKFPYWDVYERVFRERRSPEAYAKLRELQQAGLPRTDPEAWANAYKNALFTGWVANENAVLRMKSNPMAEPNIDPERQTTKYFGLLRDLGEWDWRLQLELVECPALVVYGSSDPMPAKASEEWTAALPVASSAVIQKSGRLPWVEQPGAFFESVQAFLSGG